MKRRVLRTSLLLAVAFGLYAFIVVPLVQGLTMPDEIILTPSEYSALSETESTALTGDDPAGEKTITVKLLGLIPLKKVLVNVLPFDTILVGGTPLGICGQIDGVLVTADTPDQVLRTGDLITAVDGVTVQSLSDYTQQTAGKSTATLTVTRDRRSRRQTVDLTQTIHLRDETNGVGVLTFINPANNNFSALGHQMTDFETGTAVNLRGGTVRPVHTFGITKTDGHKTGVMQSSIRQNATPEGSITHGTNFGVAGCLRPDSSILAASTTTMPVATRYQVKPGAATLRTTLDGATIEEFACEILKTRYQNQKGEKSMVIRVTDPRLLTQTGGIIHGMSGSPIIQNGHVVGALTHALTHDPAKGYAVYIDFVAI